MKRLKLENAELRHILLKLISKYKTSEIKRKILLRRNLLLFTDNKNLHQQLLEARKKRIVTEISIANYRSALDEIIKEWCGQKKKQFSAGDETTDVLSEIVKLDSCSMEPPDKSPLLANEESSVYFEVVSNDSQCKPYEENNGDTQKLKMTSTSNTKLEGTPRVDDFRDANVNAYYSHTHNLSQTYSSEPEMPAYYHMVDKEVQIPNQHQPLDRLKIPGIANHVSERNINENHFEQKRRLFNRITELIEMSSMRDKELEKKRSIVADKTKMVQRVHCEIRRIQQLISFTKN